MGDGPAAKSPSTGFDAHVLDRVPRPRWLVPLAAAFIGVLYLATVTGRWWPTPDSALYLGLGRSLAAGGGYQFNGQVCTSVTPGLPLLLAGLHTLFGPGNWAPNLLMAACAVGALAVIHRAIARLSDRWTALMVVLCCGLSYTFYFSGHRVLTDAPFSLLFWAVTWACLRALRGSRWWLLAVAALTAAAVTVRAPGALVLGALALGLLLHRGEGVRRRKLALLAGEIVAVALAALAGFYLLGRPLAGITPLYLRSLQRLSAASLPGLGLRLAQGLAALPKGVAETLTSQDDLPVIGLAAIACMGVGGVALWRRGRRLAFVAAAGYVLVLSLAGGARAARPRYLLPVQPLLIYLAIQGLLRVAWALCRWRRRSPGPSALLRVAVAFTAVMVVINGPRLLRNVVYYTYLSYTPRYYEVIRSGRHAELVELAGVLRREVAPGETAGLMGKRASILHYLSDRRILTVRRPPARAGPEAVLAVLNSQPRLAGLAVDVSGLSESFRRALVSAAEAAPDVRVLYQGRRYVALARPGGPAER